MYEVSERSWAYCIPKVEVGERSEEIWIEVKYASKMKEQSKL